MGIKAYIKFPTILNLILNWRKRVKSSYCIYCGACDFLYQAKDDKCPHCGNKINYKKSSLTF